LVIVPMATTTTTSCVFLFLIKATMIFIFLFYSNKSPVDAARVDVACSVIDVRNII
jgi:hypothetical protein